MFGNEIESVILQQFLARYRSGKNFFTEIAFGVFVRCQPHNFFNKTISMTETFSQNVF